MASAATIRRGNSNPRVRPRAESRGSNSRPRSESKNSGGRPRAESRNSGGRPRSESRNSNSSRGRRSRTSGGSNSLMVGGADLLDFNGLQATIEVMDPGDLEYEDTCLIFLSSRYQLLPAFHRAHKDSQLIVKAQWVEYWASTAVAPEKRIKTAVAAKMFVTCTFLAKGKSGVTPTSIDNLQKTLPRKYRSVTSAGAVRQLERYSWFVNGQETRDVSRPSQVLTPQKYEELIARLRADAESSRMQLINAQRAHEREMHAVKDKLKQARAQVKRMQEEQKQNSE